MVLQSHAELRFDTHPVHRASRLRVGSIMLGSVVALLALLNLIAGAA